MSAQQHLTNRQNEDQHWKEHRPPSGECRLFITRRRTRKGLNRRECTKPYNTRATVAKWMRTNWGTRKDTTKHDGDYSSTRSCDILRNNTDPEPETDQTNHHIANWRNQKTQSPGTWGLPRRTTQTTRLASQTHSILQNSGMAERPQWGKNPICNQAPKGQCRDLEHTIRRRTNHPNVGYLSSIQSGITKMIWRNWRQRGSKNDTEDHETGQKIGHGILEWIPASG